MTNTHYISIINIIILVILTRWRALPWHAWVQLVYPPQVVRGGAERGSKGGLDQNSSRWTFFFSTNKIMRLQVTHTWCSGCLSSERVSQKWPPMDTFLSLLFILRYTSLHLCKYLCIHLYSFEPFCVHICVYFFTLLCMPVYTFVSTQVCFCITGEGTFQLGGSPGGLFLAGKYENIKYFPLGGSPGCLRLFRRESLWRTVDRCWQPRL